MTSAGPSGASSPFGKYRIVGELGRGGMGAVYRARDDSLQRDVALKVLRAPAPACPGAPTPAPEEEDVHRFRREAHAMARLDHPNIVPVFEVGEADGVPYLVMEHVPDGSLRDFALHPWRPGPPSDDLLRLLAEVARAVHYAHEHGIIHRDLKPGNILVRRDPNGIPHAVVADFGLARAVDGASQLTRSGTAIGTPEYMSPEQCEGRRAIDGRSDVFSLGIVLYEILTGVRPFTGESPVAAMFAVIEREPHPPRARNPGISIDLETVVLRALEKERNRRYPTAAALADDLERVRAGEPVHARPISTTVRILRSVRRHRVSWAASLLAVGLLLAGAVPFHLARERDRKALADALTEGRDRRVRELPREARDAFARALALEPAHAEAREGFAWADAAARRLDEAAAEEARRAREREAAAREDLRKAGLVQRVLARWVAVAPALEAMEATFHDSTLDADGRRRAAADRWPEIEAFLAGTPDDPTSRAAARPLAAWARRLAGFEEEARAWIAAARALDPDLPYATLLEALLGLSDLLLHSPLPPTIHTATGLEFGPLPAEPKERAAVHSRVDALLAEASAARVWGEGLAEEFRDVLAAALAFRRGEWREAEAGFSRALGAAGLAMFRREILHARAKARYLLGRFTDGVEDAERALAARPRQAELRFLLGTLRIGQAEAASAGGVDPRPLLARAEDDFRAAAAGRASYPDAWNGAGGCLVRRAEIEDEAGLDPAPALDRAIECFGRALAADPALTEALNNRGLARVKRARAESDAGRDPQPLLDAALADLDAGLALDPANAEAEANRGLVLVLAGDAAEARGEDPRPLYVRALAAHDRALERRREGPDLLKNRAAARLAFARSEHARGGDPAPVIVAVLADLERALALAPENLEALQARGNLRWFEADVATAAGQDPAPSFDAALADYERASTLRPGAVGPRLNRAGVWVRRGEEAAARGEDPDESFRRAEVELSAVLEHAPDHAGARADRGAVRAKRAESALASGRSAAALFRAAIEDLDAALAARPDAEVPRLNRAASWWSLGEWMSAADADPREAFESAAADYGEALRRRPGRGNAWGHRGAVRLSLAEARLAYGGDARAAAEGALGDFDEAVRRDPADARAFENRGHAWSLRGDIDANDGIDPAPAFARALADYDAAVRLAPGFWPTLANRAVLLRRLGRGAEGRRDLEAALRLAPDEPRLRALREEFGKEE